MAKNWTKLDNAAKIFPANTSPRDTKVFRFACDLTEQVDPSLLQSALDATLLEYPLYRSVLKRGLFWYYFEASNLPVFVALDDQPPCAPLYDRVRRRLLFRVTYYGRRINLEVHHTLADGTGAARFLCAMVRHYLTRRHPAELADATRTDYDASPTQRREDSFMKYYDPRQRQDRPKAKAYQLKGAQLPEWRMLVFEGVMDADALLERARARGATITGYLTAQLMIAISEEMPLRHRDKPVVITVPINLRPYFQSQTARNFFSTMDIGYDFREGDSLDTVIGSVMQSFKAELTQQRIARRMNHLISLETNVFARSAPLLLKDFVLRRAGINDKKRHTAALTNLGIIAMPERMRPYIDRFSVIVSTGSIQASLSTFNGKATVNVVSAFVSTEVPRRFYRQLAADGIHIAIANNLIGEKEEV